MLMFIEDEAEEAGSDAEATETATEEEAAE